MILSTAQIKEKCYNNEENILNYHWGIFFFKLNYPLQYSCLENPTDGGAWWAAVHGVARSRTRLSDFTFAFHFHALEKEMATHSSILAWRIPGMAEPGGLPSMGLHRVGHDWSNLAAAAAAAWNNRKMPFFIFGKGEIPFIIFSSIK